MIERRRPPYSHSGPDDNGAVRTDGGAMWTTAYPPIEAPRLATTSAGLTATIWRSRWIVLVCTVAALSGGFVYINVAVPTYTSTAKLYLRCESIQISQYESGAIPRTDKYLHTQAEVLRSREILAAAFGTDEDPPLRTFAAVEVPLNHLRKMMVVDVGRKDEIISISFDSPYPQEAAQIVNRVVEAYMTSRSESDRKDATKALNICELLLNQREAELKAKAAELREFRARKMPVSRGLDDGASVRQGYEECQRDYRQAQQAASTAKLYLDGVRELAESPEALRQYVQAEGGGVRHVAPSSGRLSLETLLMELNARRAELLRQYTESHAAVTAVDDERRRLGKEIADLDAQFVAATIAAAERQYAEARTNERVLAERYDEESENVQRFSDEQQQFQQLQAEVSRLEISVATYTQQVGEIAKIVGDDAGRMGMAILEPALPSQKPSAPQKGKVMALALMLGLVAGGAIAVARDWADQTFRSMEEISATLGLPVLGVVPAMSRRQKEQTRGRKVLLQPDSPEAEAYRTVRTALFFGTSGESMRTLLVTSPVAGDGKSTLIGNLGIAMAQAGQNTLILDADLRRPMQHQIFSTDHSERNLNSVFSGRMTLSEAIQPTPVSGLSLLTCAHGVSSPAEFLNSDRFAELLEELTKIYDRVLVDAPPVTVVTDAQILGALCDCTILVMRVERSSRKTARRAVNALESVGARLFGVVVNAVRKSGDRYGYYGRYGGYSNSHRCSSENGRAKDGGIGIDLSQEDANAMVVRS